MDWERKMTMDSVRYFVLGVAIVILLAIILFNPIEIPSYDHWFVEIQVVEKEVKEINGDKVYLLHCEDSEGKQDIYEIAKEAIGERFEEPGVFREIKTGKYYKFQIGKAEEFGAYYPCVCGAVKLIEGFSETTAGQNH